MGTLADQSFVPDVVTAFDVRDGVEVKPVAFDGDDLCDPMRSQVCLRERSKQVLEQTRGCP